MSELDAGGAEIVARVPAETPQRRLELSALLSNAAELEANRHAPNTRKSYRSDFAHFSGWCDYMGLDALPAVPETVYLYLSALTDEHNAARWAVTTLERRLSAIKWVHETGNFPSPTAHTRVKELMAGIRRTYGKRPNKREALDTAQIARIIDSLDLATNAGLRDRALILCGYAGAFRRGELAGLSRHQLIRANEGYIIALDRTKDDQEGKGRDTGIPAVNRSALCPVAAIDAWLTAAEITDGAVFRRVTRWDTIGDQPLNPGSVAKILKRRAAAVGIPPDRIAGHSLRAGHLTEAAHNGASDRALMDQAGHKSMDTTHGYIRPGTVFRTNSANYLGLEHFTGHPDPAASSETL